MKTYIIRSNSIGKDIFMESNQSMKTTIDDFARNIGLTAMITKETPSSPDVIAHVHFEIGTGKSFVIFEKPTV